MAQSFLPAQQDTRTFGAQQTRLLTDLNRPDLSDVVINYLQDAMRYFQRKAFFFSEIDNTVVPQWAANTNYPQGSVIQQLVGPTTFAMCAVSSGAQMSGPTAPTWSSTPFTVPIGSGNLPPPPLSAPGVTADGGVIWANIGPYIQGFHTQLSTVYCVNQYQLPIDYIAPYMVQITTSNHRVIVEKISFLQLSEWDVIRPAPIAAYPRFWAYWQQLLYIWVYPASFYPITLNYTTGPQLVQLATDTNFWTTQAERLVRKYAQAAINREVLYDQTAAQLAMGAVNEELDQLKAQAVAQQGYNIPAWDW